MKRMFLLFPAWLILFILLLPILEGCGKSDDELIEDLFFKDIYSGGHRPDIFIDPDLQKYLDEYDSTLAEYGIDVDRSILYRLEYVDELKDGDKELLGICYRYRDQEGSYATVKIKRVDNPLVIRAIVFHELGHCIQSLDHSKKSGSLMYPSLTINPLYYEENWTKLVDEMVEYIKFGDKETEDDAA